MMGLASAAMDPNGMTRLCACRSRAAPKPASTGRNTATVVQRGSILQIIVPLLVCGIGLAITGILWQKDVGRAR